MNMRGTKWALRKAGVEEWLVSAATATLWLGNFEYRIDMRSTISRLENFNCEICLASNDLEGRTQFIRYDGAISTTMVVLFSAPLYSALSLSTSTRRYGGGNSTSAEEVLQIPASLP